MTLNNILQEILQTLPDHPGVYQFYDAEGKILYIGKAKSLQKRVRSYFQKPVHDSAKTNILVRKVVDVKTILVDTEFDALLLENSLIKKYKPRYNILLKDDKTYPWICIKKEPFPRVFSTRKVIKDGSQYFGPYANGKVLFTLLELIKQLYPLRTCALDLSPEVIAKGKHRPCLEYQIGNCMAPCIGKESEQDYQQYLAQVKDLVRGNFGQVKKMLQGRMQIYAQELQFEKAQEIKEKLDALEGYQSKSTVVSPTIHDVEVYSIYQDGSNASAVNFFKVVNGAIIQSHTVEVVQKLDESPSELLLTAILDLRERFQSDSKEVLISVELENTLPGVEFTLPKVGDKRKLVDLSLNNAKFFLMDVRKRAEIKDPERKTDRVLETLRKDLRLKELPAHMECFDNSNFQGTNAVSACVVFKDAKPAKKDYRHFNIKTVEGPNDFASMTEVVYRRYKRLLEENQPLPQLILIDGGKGQLGAAVEALTQLGIYGKVAVIGIAKRLEELFFPGDSVPLYLDKKSESLRVLQHMRNEAHRFGITHHRNKRSKEYTSELLKIPGVGPKTMEALLGHFKSVKRLQEASLEEIQVYSNAKTAQAIKNYFP